MHADRQLPETVALTQEQQKQSRERVKALIREVNRKLGIQDFEQEEGDNLDRIEERKELLRQQADELTASGEQKRESGSN